MIKMLLNSPIKPSFRFIHQSYLKDRADSLILIEHYLQSDDSPLPNSIKDLRDDYNNSSLALCSLGNTIKYLEDLLIADKTVPFGEFFKHTEQTLDK